MLRRFDATSLIARFWTVIGLMLPPRKWYSRRVETQRARFMELKEDLQKGFYKDMAEKNRSALSSSSSSSSSPKEGVKCKAEELQACIVVLSQLWLLEVVEKALVEDVIPILMAALHCQLNQLRSYWIQRIARSNLDNVCLEKELPDEVSSEIKSLRVKYNQESEANIAEVNPINAKVVRGIHRALDSGDVELLKLLLDVSNVTLDDAYTLHYAAAYCNPMVFKEVLNMGSAGLNLKDARGRTVLHVAARHKEPAVMVALLSKGAWASETTSDGQTALAICRRMTREMRRNSMSGNLAMSAEVMDDDFQRKLDYMENIVACVRLFPSEARVAMEIAGADTTTGLSALGRKGLSGNLKEVDLNETPKEVDLNETPSMQAKRCQLRLLALLKTVETGQRYFPNCSEVVEKFMFFKFMFFNPANCSELVDEFLDCDSSDASLLEKGTPEVQKLQRACFMKLKVEMPEAFCKDVAYQRRSGLPSSWSAFYKYMAESNRSDMPASSASSN
ncbi:BTB/POZ domain and ankyrin repeat-containing protein NPR2 [Citrus sinensis]|uniref:BTB/POZ domain and ankyrin repeat-containing protein NPR2 n=1 Tax=Citrus sinensis TaxID=2711 RepID=A0ACB8LBC9_CITSI|nr:BTB/POZ domain and ankyrin repeat-containing protein NPR2 [Citrus sinensis]